MTAFYRKKYNLLVCTTIIESGIDVPNANTIIINRADLFGLAQLHQLRGRVGRGHHQAYAYLLLPEEKNVTGNAKKRIAALVAMKDLGSGFTLATHDLEIRGAGEILGEDQSGQIHTLGYDLYMQYLTRAIEDVRTNKEDIGEIIELHSNNTELDLHLPILIPESYIADITSKIKIYRQIARAQSEHELQQIKADIADRFGPVPQEMVNLLAATMLKIAAEKMRIKKIFADSRKAIIEFCSTTQIKSATILSLVQQNWQDYKLKNGNTLEFNLKSCAPNMILPKIQHLLALLWDQQ
jgi:transcription-repair coupling factor (superfamily II helicase)